MKEMMAIQFYLNNTDDIISGHDYTIVDYLDEENSVVEVLVEKDKWNEIRVEAKDYEGLWKIYEIEELESFKDGKETKYAVMVWNPIN